MRDDDGQMIAASSCELPFKTSSTTSKQPLVGDAGRQTTSLPFDAIFLQTRMANDFLTFDVIFLQLKAIIKH